MAHNASIIACVLVFPEAPENPVTNRPMFDDMNLVDGYRRDSQGGEQEKYVWCPILPAQKPISVLQDHLMSLEVASQVENSDVLGGPNVAETIFPIY